MTKEALIITAGGMITDGFGSNSPDPELSYAAQGYLFQAGWKYALQPNEELKLVLFKEHPEGLEGQPVLVKDIADAGYELRDGVKEFVRLRATALFAEENNAFGEFTVQEVDRVDGDGDYSHAYTCHIKYHSGATDLKVYSINELLYA